jgi:hypothetical protein
VIAGVQLIENGIGAFIDHRVGDQAAHPTKSSG